MSAGGQCIALFRELIGSLQSSGIDKIWMKVTGDGDFTMANVLGFLEADLILLLKTTGLITSSNKIINADAWCTRFGIPMEWNKYKRELWCRFKFESKNKSSPSDNNEALLNQFNAAKVSNGFGSARRKAFEGGNGWT